MRLLGQKSGSKFPPTLQFERRLRQRSTAAGGNVAFVRSEGNRKLQGTAARRWNPGRRRWRPGGASSPVGQSSIAGGERRVRRKATRATCGRGRGVGAPRAKARSHPHGGASAAIPSGHIRTEEIDSERRTGPRAIHLLFAFESGQAA